MESEKEVLVSILNWRSAEDTVRCVNAVKKIIDQADHIVVVDNASGDNSETYIKANHPDIHLIITPKNLGYAAGHHFAVNYALAHDYDAIWILNPDLELHPNSLKGLVKAWQEKGLGIYGSVSLQSLEDDTIVFAGAHELDGNKELTDYNPWKRRSFQETPEAQQVRKVSAIEGFSMLIPLEIIRQHGFMDHRYFMYGEETIWCYDLRKKGVPVYIVPDSIVYHTGYGSLGGANASSNPVVVYYRMRNAIYWKRKHCGLSRWKVLQKKGGPWAFIRFFLKYVAKGHDWRVRNKKNYLENMAILHAFLGIKGRRVA